jgi:baculoviral IAP repeat-containing protein 6
MLKLEILYYHLDSYELLVESPDTAMGSRFTVAYHFENAVKAAGDRCHPNRMKRLAQEVATLTTSLPLSLSSSVFVRCDTDRLDIMKVCYFLLVFVMIFN